MSYGLRSSLERSPEGLGITVGLDRADDARAEFREDDPDDCDSGAPVFAGYGMS